MPSPTADLSVHTQFQSAPNCENFADGSFAALFLTKWAGAVQLAQRPSGQHQPVAQGGDGASSARWKGEFHHSLLTIFFNNIFVVLLRTQD